MMCFQRRPAFYSPDVDALERERCAADLHGGKPPMEALRFENRSLLYGYTLINSLLPGADRLPYKGASTLFDLRLRDGEASFRLYDRILRNWHAADAPFALEPFENGLEVYGVVDGEMRRQQSRAFPAVRRFDDSDPQRYLNPHLPFGGVDLPRMGFSFELGEVGEDAPAGSRVRVSYRFAAPAADAQ